MYILVTQALDDTTNHIAPQVESMGPGYAWEADNSIRHIRDNKPLAFTPNFNTLILDQDTRLTDLISQLLIPAPGLLLSAELLAMIKAYVIQKYVVYDAPVSYRGQRHDYYWLHFTEQQEQSINFQQSVFGLYNMDNHWQQDLTFAGYGEFAEKCQELTFMLGGQLVPKKLTFVDAEQPDLFVIMTTEPIYYVSNKLAEELQASNTIGYQLIPSQLQIVF